MKPEDEDPPIQVMTTRGFEDLLRRRIEGLRAKGLRYEVIHLDEVLRPGKSGRGRR